MDLNKIFLKEACPAAIGGQAVLDGVMMRGLDRTAIACRIPDGRIFLKTHPNKKRSRWSKLPIVRGVVAFIMSLVEGMKALTYSADVAERFMDGEDDPGRIEQYMLNKFGEKKVWNMMLVFSVTLALLVSVVVFVLLPTVAIGWMKNFIVSSIILNLIEGVLRLVILVGYIVIIAHMDEMKKLFQYHGAEHKTIHCFENNLELTPENASEFYTLHPRCGTSFLMFVLIISLIVFSFLGWPPLIWRIVSRILLIPVVAGISFEVLKLAGRGDNMFVRILSIPGLYLQKLTTRNPDAEQLEIAICSLKAVLVDKDEPFVEGFCDNDANLMEEMSIDSEKGIYEVKMMSDKANATSNKGREELYARSIV